MDDAKPFYMHTSKANCYPMHTLLHRREAVNEILYCNPYEVAEIKTKYLYSNRNLEPNCVKRQLGGTISALNAPARHNKRVRVKHE